jgi:tetratricopeptide (TPR) repeat protein
VVTAFSKIALASLALLALLGTPSASAQNTLPQLETIEVAEPLHMSLVNLQEQWLEWLTAYHARDQARASEVLAEILSVMRDLQMERLSDLSLGALASAVQAARSSDFERAAWALEAAELLDPGRSESAFAAATISRLEGRRLRALALHVSGYFRLVWFRWERGILLHDIGLWLLIILVLAGGLFIALMVASKGAELYRDFADLLSGKLPMAVAHAAALALLFFPVVLPTGLLWLLAYLSVLLWAYCSRSERVVVALVWLVMGIVPVLVAQQRERVEVMMSPSVRAIESLSLGRMEGSMLTDLGGLRLVLPESVAVKHLLGDVHQKLGQWEFARSSYLEVIDAEPGNAAAMNDLGAFYFRVGDHASAIQLFQRASGDDTVAAAAFFNLSQAYSASYHFDQSSQTLALARRADETSVSEWLQLSQAAQVVTVLGGFERVDDIRAELLEVWHPAESRQSLGAALLGAMSFRLAIIVIVLAMVLERLGRGRGFYRKRPDTASKAHEPDDSLRRILVPGMAAAIDGHGERAFGELLLPVALLTLPLVGVIGYRIPWGYDPGGLVIWAISGLGMLAYLSRRVIRGLRN